MMTKIKAEKMRNAIVEKFGEESACVKVFENLVADLIDTDKANELFVVFYEIMAE